EAAARDLTPLRPLTKSIHIVTSPALRRKRLGQVADLALRRSHVLNVFSPAEAGTVLDEVLAREGCDAVLFESVRVAGYRIPEPVRVIIDQHNIEYEIVRRTFDQEHSLIRKGYSWLEWRSL